MPIKDVLSECPACGSHCIHLGEVAGEPCWGELEVDGDWDYVGHYCQGHYGSLEDGVYRHDPLLVNHPELERLVSRLQAYICNLMYGDTPRQEIKATLSSRSDGQLCSFVGLRNNEPCWGEVVRVSDVGSAYVCAGHRGIFFHKDYTRSPELVGLPEVEKLIFKLQRCIAGMLYEDKDYD